MDVSVTCTIVPWSFWQTDIVRELVSKGETSEDKALALLRLAGK